MDGPVGELLRATNRHPNRPAHVHFIADAPGHSSITTHSFVAGSPYLDSDAVFAVKGSLITDYEWVDDPTRAEAAGLPNPFRTPPSTSSWPRSSRDEHRLGLHA